MGPETWEPGNDTPVNLRGYKSKFEKNDQFHDNKEQKIHVKVFFFVIVYFYFSI